MEKTLFKEKKIEEEEEEEEEKTENNAPLIGRNKYVEAVGRRKRAIARVRIFDNFEKKGQVQIIVNDRHYDDYFTSINLKKLADAPLRKLKIFDNYKIVVKVKGGGLRGQADAIKLGIARALVKICSDWRPKLKKSGLLTRNPREKERKKYGLKKARKSPQWHKR